MKITFLGTNGWYDTATGTTVSILVETATHYLILDAGSGFQKARTLLIDRKPVFLFLSHLHLDHIIGLHTLPLFSVPQGIDLYAPKKELMLLRRDFLIRPFTSPPALLRTRVRFHDVMKAPPPIPGFVCRRLCHSVPCYGYRFSDAGATVCYATDTGPCGGLTRLAAGADLLITECAMRPGEHGPHLFHLTPEDAAAAAKDAQAKRLALIHFDPGKYPSRRTRDEAVRAAQGIFADTVAVNDGDVITL